MDNINDVLMVLSDDLIDDLSLNDTQGVDLDFLSSCD